MLPEPEPSGLPSGWELDLLRAARVARLGLLDAEDRPRVLPVTHAIHSGRIWIAIDLKPKRADREPARLRYLRRRAEVALTVDRYDDDDWTHLAWVQVLGRASIHDAREAKKPLEALAEKYPQYRENLPPGPVIAIVPDRVLSWRARDGRPASARSSTRGRPARAGRSR